MGEILFSRDERTVMGQIPEGMSIKTLVPLIQDEPLLEFVVPAGKAMIVKAQIVVELIDTAVVEPEGGQG